MKEEAKEVGLAFTCSIYGRTGSLQGTKALSSKGHVLLVEGQTLCF